MPHHTLLEERVSIFIGINAIIQFVGDVILEGMGLIPPRINHLALTFLNAFISWKTLSAIQKDKFRFLHEDCQIFWWLELLLIIGDIYYSFKDEWGREFILVRLSFVCCSLFNWLFVTYIIVKYKLYHLTYQGTEDEENVSQANPDINNSDRAHCSAEPSQEYSVSPASHVALKIGTSTDGQTKQLDGEQKNGEHMNSEHMNAEIEQSTERKKSFSSSDDFTHSEIP